MLSLSAGSEATNKALVCLFKSAPLSVFTHMECLWLVGGTGCRGLVVAAVHFLLHGTVLLQLLAGVVGDLQEAAGLHHHVGLAGVRQDGVLNDLQIFFAPLCCEALHAAELLGLSVGMMHRGPRAADELA